MYVQYTFVCNPFVAFASKVDCSQQSENTLFSIDVGKILPMYIAFSNAFTQTFSTIGIWSSKPWKGFQQNKSKEINIFN